MTDFINSSLIPERYRNPADAAMILDMSKKMRIPATTIATNLVEYGGRQGWKATFVIQTINASGLFKGLLKFKYVGDKDTESYGCYAYATEAATDEVISGDVVDMFMVKQNKWDQAEDSPWKKSSMHDLMLKYRAASFFSRVYCSQILQGLQSVEELRDVINPDSIPVKAESSSSNEVNLNESIKVLEKSDTKPVESKKVVPENSSGKSKKPNNTKSKTATQQKELNLFSFPQEENTTNKEDSIEKVDEVVVEPIGEVKSEVSSDIEIVYETVEDDSNDESKSKSKRMSKDLLEDLEKAAFCGFDISDPKINQKGEYWVKAEPVDETAEVEYLINELDFQFFSEKKIYARNVTQEME
ncbi:MAG: hypothetical protein ACPGUI_00525 [Halarcobacter sp.]